MKLINLTPHPIHLLLESGFTLVLASDGEARVSQTETEVAVVPGIDVPIVETTYGEVTGLPEPQPGAYYIVSRMLLAASPDRDDLLVPAGMVRDEQGRVVGARALSRN